MKRKRKSPASQILPLLRDRIFLNTGKFKLDSFTVDCMNKKKKKTTKLVPVVKTNKQKHKI